MTPDSLCSAGEGAQALPTYCQGQGAGPVCARLVCMRLASAVLVNPSSCMSASSWHDDAFDGSRRCLGIKTLILQKFVERRPDATFFSCDLLPAGHRSIRIYYAASTDSRPARLLAPRGDDAASRRNQQQRLHHRGQIVEAMQNHRQPDRIAAIAEIAEQEADRKHLAEGRTSRYCRCSAVHTSDDRTIAPTGRRNVSDQPR